MSALPSPLSLDPAARVIARRYNLHVPGLVYAGITVLLVLGAINGQNNLLFWAFGLAIAGILISGFLSAACLMKLDISREPVAPAHAGDDLTLRYRVRNHNRFFPSFALVVEELESLRPSRGLPPVASTWPALLPRARVFVAHVPPRGEVIVEARVKPWHAGGAEFRGVRVSTTFPFGLTLKSVLFAQDAGTIIRPWVLPLTRAALPELLSPTHRADSRRVTSRPAHDAEFHSLREFGAGDSTRRIAWKASARAQHILVRRDAARASRRVWLVVEFPADPLAAQRAASFAAGLIARLTDPRSTTELGLLIPGRGLAEPPRAGPAQRSRLFDALALSLSPTYLPQPKRHVTRGDAVILLDGAHPPAGAPVLARLSSTDAALAGDEAWALAPTPHQVTPPRVRWWTSLFQGGTA